MLQSTPFLLFDGNCAEAMTFYHECLGGELVLTRVGDTPMKDQFPPEKYSKIINACLKTEAIQFSATDWLHPTLKPVKGNTVGIFVIGGSYSEVKNVFDKLSEGVVRDEHFIDLKDMPFGSYGHFYDKFGVSWFFKGEKNV